MFPIKEGLLFLLLVINSASPGKLGDIECSVRGGRGKECHGERDGNEESCVFPFSYNGAVYYGCTETDRNKLWCALKTDDKGVMKDDKWGYCKDACTKCQHKVCTKGEGDHHRCKFGYRLDGYKQYGCTTQGKGYLWCATHLTDDEGHFDEWRNCTGLCNREECKTSAGPTAGSQCVFPFLYKGVLHSNCTMEDRNVPWCATKVFDNKTIVPEQWGACGMSCPF